MVEKRTENSYLIDFTISIHDFILASLTLNIAILTH